jgi:hypothetical protein
VTGKQARRAAKRLEAEFRERVAEGWEPDGRGGWVIRDASSAGKTFAERDRVWHDHRASALSRESEAWTRIREREALASIGEDLQEAARSWAPRLWWGHGIGPPPGWALDEPPPARPFDGESPGLFDVLTLANGSTVSILRQHRAPRPSVALALLGAS